MGRNMILSRKCPMKSAPLMRRRKKALPDKVTPGRLKWKKANSFSMAKYMRVKMLCRKRRGGSSAPEGAAAGPCSFTSGGVRANRQAQHAIVTVDVQETFSKEKRRCRTSRVLWEFRHLRSSP